MMRLDDSRSRGAFGRQRRSTGGWWLLLLALALGGGYWYFGPEGVPDWVSGWLPGGPDTTTLYKWQGENGNWHVGDTPPEGVPYEAMEVRQDVNVIPRQEN